MKNDMNRQIDVAARAARRGFELVDWVAELFQKLGYEVEKEIKIAGIGVDLLVTRDGLSTPVEVSTSPPLGRVREIAARLHFIRAAVPSYGSPIIVTLRALPEAKTWTEETFEARLWDAAILDEKAKSFKRLAERLSSPIGDGPIDSPGGAPKKEHTDESSSLIERLTHHQKHGDLSPTDYEKLCLEVMTCGIPFMGPDPSVVSRLWLDQLGSLSGTQMAI